MAAVMLVEDDGDVAAMLLEVLEGLGHTVQSIPTATAALVALETTPPDLLITDMMLPGGLSGLGLAQQVRTRFPGLPIVVSTGYSEREPELRAAGFLVLCKPFRTAVLEATIRTALAG